MASRKPREKERDRQRGREGGRKGLGTIPFSGLLQVTYFFPLGPTN
jgi:hypothetical protein